MIQEMAAGYWTGILIGYLKAGIIGWIVWFAASLVYVFLSFGTNLTLYRTDAKGDGKWGFKAIMRIILWPYGMMYLTHELVKHVEKKLHGKE